MDSGEHGVNRLERKKEETRKKIIDTAMGLFYEQGFDATTMEQIAEMADIAKRTLYNHFSVKEAILSEYIQRLTKNRIVKEINRLKEMPDTRSRLIICLSKSIEWVELNREIMEKYIAYRMQNLGQACRDKSIRSGFEEILIRIIEIGQKAGEIRDDIPIEMLTNQLHFIHASILIGWLAHSERYSAYESIAKNVDLFLNGALKKPD